MFLVLLLIFSDVAAEPVLANTFVVILGTAQDGGYPHAGCKRKCCEIAWSKPSLHRYVVSFALVDSASSKWWLFEATPDIKYQLQYFRSLTKAKFKYLPDGIFITHAHIGHYTGLMQLGREVMNTADMPVYVLGRMKNFLENNGPWSQLVKLHNISIHQLAEDSDVVVSAGISVRAFRVPHRDEYSETAGFKIQTADKKYLFIPDIDKWQKWDKSIVDEVKTVDVALLDGTFYAATELPNRKISEVPHPFVPETMDLFKNEKQDICARIVFIHFNHTNPLLRDGAEKRACMKRAFRVAEQGQRL